MGMNLKEKMIISFISIILIALIFPIKYAKNLDELVDGYLLEIDQTTGPYWRIKMVKGDNLPDITGQLVILKGYDPYLKLNKDVVTSPKNQFFITVSSVEEHYNEELNEEFKILTVKGWDICYPISRELGLVSYSKKYLNIFDFHLPIRGQSFISFKQL